MPRAASTAPSSLYVDLARRLTEEINGRRYTVGSLLPTEIAMAQQYGVSRQTVRAALDILQDRGYVSRKKSVGTRVESVDASTHYVQTVDSIEDLVRVAASEIRQIVTVREFTLDRSGARQLQAPLGSKWLVFSGYRVDTRDGKPLAVANFYVDIRFAKIQEEVMQQPQVLISSMIEGRCNESITDVVQIADAVLIDAAMAAALQVPKGSAGLRVLRHYKNIKNELLEISETVYPAERRSLLTQLRRTRRGS
ncbi:GntR family transcriptional regulator [Variovorax sp. 770b2]|uniref:GntR family transcriptional regulator n=1 Tax=Variovorax sp. 770b2 TaxID=1566271 RepID=UPI0008E7F7E8|nr:GntR family transcriptional regulator [Variovorax sp. 770b2]SFP91866.1 DNA-binding transcriptional regulator, GntR family [Variovorax sp. 770b2]